ncbi:MAG: hypothetical protein K2J32_01090 [Ruminococcus sp.]|nr:hypothetical protein [Ruminococcus sp.]
MALFGKKKNQPEPEEKNPAKEIKTKVLECLNEKLNGNLYDECVIMPRGFTIDVQIGKQDEKDGVKLVQVIFIVKNDDFDEALIEPVDAQGRTDDDAVKMAVEMFYGAVWHPINQSLNKTNGIHLSINYLGQHYDFDMYAQSVVRTSTSNGQPVMLINYIKSEIPKYIGSKKYYWVRIYLAKFKDRKVVEVRVNGSVCAELSRFYQAYVDSWNNEQFMMEKQYAIFVQREDDKAPEAYKKEHVVSCAKQCIEMMENCNSRDEYMELVTKLEEITGDKNLASEIRIFIPEIFAKLTLGYREGDSLFLIDGEGTIEFKKTQLRSYFYLQQVVLEYFTKKPEQARVMKIVSNSVAFRELKKAHEQGHEPKDLFVPGTSYKIATDDYKVW